MFHVSQFNAIVGSICVIVLAGAIASPSFAGPLVGRQSERISFLELPSNNGLHTDNDTAEIPGAVAAVEIPRRFAGCWLGQVSESNLTLIKILAKPGLSGWLTKHYRVCFEREATGFKTVLADGDVAPHEAVLEARSVLTVVSASHSAIAMRGSLKMVERLSDVFGLTSVPPGMVDEHLHLEGNLSGDGVMRVQGLVKGYHNGKPWFVANWNSDFQYEPLR